MMAIQYESISRLSNGANFFTADLHIHTFGGSPCVKDASMTVENIIENAVKRKVSIIAITDHNNIVHTENAIEYGRKYGGSLLVIPGMEITTSNGHLLVYFPPDNISKLRKLMTLIDIVDEGTQNSHTKKSMAEVINESERLGGICIAAHIDRLKTGFEVLASGYPNWKKDIITSAGLLGLEFDDLVNLNWYSFDDDSSNDGGERKKLLEQRRQADIKYIRNSIAHIQNSDAHSIEEFNLNIDNGHLTRFKMDELSFNGFKTALADSDARIRVLNTIPKSFPRIVGMHISGGFLDQNTVHFSDNLNCFIGGRGTGKSTALQSLAYGFGKSDKIKSMDNCPHTIVIYAQDKNDVTYRYERQRGGTFLVQAYTRADRSINEVPSDSFKIEFYGQNDLSEVSKDPLNNSDTLQNFLDEHINLKELLSKEVELKSNIKMFNSQIKPYQISQAEKPQKEKELAEVDKKLEVAEIGKIKEIASIKTQLGAEKGLVSEIKQISDFYSRGISLRNYLRNYDQLVKQFGVLTGNQKSKEILQNIRNYILQANQHLNSKQNEINVELQKYALSLNASLSELSHEHNVLDTTIAIKIQDLQQQGLTGDVEELDTLISTKTRLAREISKIVNEKIELDSFMESKTKMIKELIQIRENITKLRESQLPNINKNLGKVIDDYLVYFHYDKTGVIDEFKNYLLKIMQGEYFQEDMARRFATEVEPSTFANLLWNNDVKAIARIASIGDQWAEKIAAKFFNYDCLYELEIMWKVPKPVITVKLRNQQAKQIPVNQLSDGQKHTILLTIAMLSDSIAPLIIDQPEDDLDNAYIYSSLVMNLRQVKERRQIVLVTHNANIAVLGDAEQILPMYRNGENGQIKDRGSIDNPATKQAVQSILEGGEIAFKKRMNMYGY
jgi:DNA repair ATPase RecN